jgi:acylphosphatase
MPGRLRQPAKPAVKKAKLYLVEGRVQGVGFRFFAERAAAELGVQGTVRNLADGRVEVYAIGEEEVLSQLRARLETGPRTGRVERIEERDAPLKATKNFSIE